MFILTFLRKLYKILSRDSSPAAIAFAASFGIAAGCVPVSCGVAWAFGLLVLALRVQISTALFTWALTRLAAASGMALLYEAVGEAFLEAESLRPLWTWFFTQIPFAAWSGLDRYAILGGLAVGLFVGVLMFLPVRHLVIAYRRWAQESLQDNRFFGWLVNFWVVKVLKFVFVGRGL